MVHEVAAVHHPRGAVHVPLHPVAAQGVPHAQGRLQVHGIALAQPTQSGAGEGLGRKLDGHAILTLLRDRQADAGDGQAVADREACREFRREADGEAYASLTRVRWVFDQSATLDDEAGEHQSVLPRIMVPAGNDRHLGRRRGVDQAVLVVDSAGPVPFEIGFEGLRFANAFKGSTEGVLDQQVDPLSW